MSVHGAAGASPPGPRGRQKVALGFLALASVAAVTTVALDLHAGTLALEGMGGLGASVFVAVAAVVVLRRPGNRVGETMTAITFLLATGGLSERLELRAEGRALGTFASWYGEWFWVPMLVLLFVALPLTFPNGRLLSRRWGAVLLVVACTGALATVAAWFQSELPVGVAYDPTELPVIDNPIGWAPWPEMEGAWPGIVFFLTLFPAALAGLWSLGMRFRRSRGTERAQLKWGALGVAVLGASFVANGLADLVLGTRPPAVAEAVAFAAMPIMLGFAILRYRLYDIDRIVSRTVSYVALTALLAGVYVAGVVGLGGLVRSLTGGGGGDLVVAASTLAVAALFGPARRRIQALVDRRFNRARYDSQRTVETFAQRLRDEVDLDALATQLRSTASATVQPRTVWLWLRTGETGP